ncbi:MAG: heme biosynthesis protein HemY [Gammaproteobacteria bacterium]|nr:heme biosynthesis protein HemY [Gammaproteobacteria bacterium]MBU2478201.1 heme biosynthesis protein HemY [Gammaproteobacteria bacterium]
MKFLVTLLISLIAAVTLGLMLVNEPGYVLIGYGEWTLETTVSLLAFTLLLGFAVLYLVLRFFAGLKRAPQRLRHWEERRKALRARNNLNRGLLELAEGNWVAAEKRLLKHAADSETPLLNHLAAARAAQQQGAHERRDHYLRLAHQGMPDADIAVGLTQAELQIAHRQMEQALATLTHLRTLAPRHAYVLKMLMHLYERLQDWEHLRDLLPELRKRGVLEDAAADQLEVRLHCELLAQAARGRDAELLRDAWNRVPRRLLQNADLVFAYATQLHGLGDDVAAEDLLRTALKKTWDDRLVDLYGRLQGDATQQLNSLEEWLRSHDRNPILLLALGRLAMRSSLWGKARGYLEAGIGIAPTVEGYQLLGALAEQLSETDLATQCYRKGMLLATGGKALVVDATARDDAESDDLPRLVEARSI